MSKDFLDVQANIECGFTPKCVRDMTRTYSHNILGLNFQTQHDGVKLKLNGNKPPTEICGLSVLNVEPLDLFCSLSHDCKPIVAKSRKFNSSDKIF